MQAGRHSHGSSGATDTLTNFAILVGRPPFRRQHWCQVFVDIPIRKGWTYNRLALQGRTNAASRWQQFGGCAFHQMRSWHLRHRRRPLEDVSSNRRFTPTQRSHGTQARTEGPQRSSRSRLDILSESGKHSNGRGSNQLMSRAALRLPCFDTNLVILSIATLA